MRDMRNSNISLVEKPEGGVDGRKILKWTLKKYGMRFWTGFVWLMIGTSGGSL
jgi:hypothetical protein